MIITFAAPTDYVTADFMHMIVIAIREAASQLLEQSTVCILLSLLLSFYVPAG